MTEQYAPLPKTVPAGIAHLVLGLSCFSKVLPGLPEEGGQWNIISTTWHNTTILTLYIQVRQV